MSAISRAISTLDTCATIGQTHNCKIENAAYLFDWPEVEKSSKCYKDTRYQSTRANRWILADHC